MYYLGYEHQDNNMKIYYLLKEITKLENYLDDPSLIKEGLKSLRDEMDRLVMLVDQTPSENDFKAILDQS